VTMLNIGAPQSEGSSSHLSGIREGDIQPNAVDLRVGKIYRINTEMFFINEEDKVHRGSEEIEPDEDGFWVLEPGSYEVIMENEITVAEGEAGFVITRSTLNRNGVFLTSGLYDSGYAGVMAGVMHVNIGPMTIQRGTRVGQYLSWNAQTLHKYDGSYGHGKEHDKKYS